MDGTLKPKNPTPNETKRPLFALPAYDETLETVIRGTKNTDHNRRLALSSPGVPVHITWWAYLNGTPAMQAIAKAKLIRITRDQASGAELSAKRWLARFHQDSSVIHLLARDQNPVVQARAVLRTEDPQILNQASQSTHPGVAAAAAHRVKYGMLGR